MASKSAEISVTVRGAPFIDEDVEAAKLWPEPCVSTKTKQQIINTAKPPSVCALRNFPCLLVDELQQLPGYLLHPAGEDQRGGAGDGGDPGLLLRLPPGHRQLAGQGRGPG